MVVAVSFAGSALAVESKEAAIAKATADENKSLAAVYKALRQNREAFAKVNKKIAELDKQLRELRAKRFNLNVRYSFLLLRRDALLRERAQDRACAIKINAYESWLETNKGLKAKLAIHEAEKAEELKQIAANESMLKAAKDYLASLVGKYKEDSAEIAAAKANVNLNQKMLDGNKAELKVHEEAIARLTAQLKAKAPERPSEACYKAVKD